MSYYISKQLKNTTFENAISKVTESLKEQGFGVITEIDVKETMKKKLDIDFRRYKILGACNPTFAHKALEVEDKIGTMLPCNVIIQENGDMIEVAAVRPISSMMAINNDKLAEIAIEIEKRLEKVVEKI